MKIKPLLIPAVLLTSVAFADDKPTSCHFCGLRTEVHYFAIHLQQRLADRTFDRKSWGIKRLRAEMQQLENTVRDKGSHEDMIKDAIDVAVAAMMVAYLESKK